MLSLMIAIILFTSATLSIIHSFEAGMTCWYMLAIAVFLYTKGLLSFLFYVRKKSNTSTRILMSRDWVIIAFGYFASALLFFLSVFKDEDIFGYVASPVILTVGIIFLLIGIWKSNLGGAAQQKAAHGPQGPAALTASEPQRYA